MKYLVFFAGLLGFFLPLSPQRFSLQLEQLSNWFLQPEQGIGSPPNHWEDFVDCYFFIQLQNYLFSHLFEVGHNSYYPCALTIASFQNFNDIFFDYALGFFAEKNGANPAQFCEVIAKLLEAFDRIKILLSQQELEKYSASIDDLHRFCMPDQKSRGSWTADIEASLLSLLPLVFCINNLIAKDFVVGVKTIFAESFDLQNSFCVCSMLAQKDFFKKLDSPEEEALFEMLLTVNPELLRHYAQNYLEAFSNFTNFLAKTHWDYQCSQAVATLVVLAHWTAKLSKNHKNQKALFCLREKDEDSYYFSETKRQNSQNSSCESLAKLNMTVAKPSFCSTWCSCFLWLKKFCCKKEISPKNSRSLSVSTIKTDPINFCDLAEPSLKS